MAVLPRLFLFCLLQFCCLQQGCSLVRSVALSLHQAAGFCPFEQLTALLEANLACRAAPGRAPSSSKAAT